MSGEFLHFYDAYADRVFLYYLVLCSDREQALARTLEAFKGAWDECVKGKSLHALKEEFGRCFTMEERQRSFTILATHAA